MTLYLGVVVISLVVSLFGLAAAAIMFATQSSAGYPVIIAESTPPESNHQ